ncbi:transcription termination factor 4, mitochondrial isoform 2-T2 [Sarcophilus harrisii]
MWEPSGARSLARSFQTVRRGSGSEPQGGRPEEGPGLLLPLWGTDTGRGFPDSAPLLPDPSGDFLSHRSLPGSCPCSVLLSRLPGWEEWLRHQTGRDGPRDGHLEHMTRCCPELFTMSQQRIDALVSVLKDKCLFSSQQVAEIVGSCPQVLQEEPMALEYKFQYAYFRMGIKQHDLVKTKYFQYSMTKIKQRHIFLERLGLYQTPDKKGQTQICNPSVNSILRVSEAEFLAKTAHSSSEEFEIFKKLLAREELEEEEGLRASDEEDPDLSDSDDSGDEKD